MWQTMTVALLLVISGELGYIIYLMMTEPVYSDDPEDPSDKSP
jgi:hypothetical protein